MGNNNHDFISRRSVLKSTGVGVGAGLLAGCLGGDGGDGSDGDGGSDGGSTGDGSGSGEPITIGGLLPLSGIYADYGPTYRAGMKMRIDEYNEEGGVLGRQLEMVSADNADSGETAVSNFSRFVEQENIVAAAGPGGLQPTIQASKFAEDNQVPLYNLAGVFPMFVNGADTRFVFRPGLMSMKNWVRPQGSWAQEEGYDKVGVIYQNGTLKNVISAAIAEYFPDGATINSGTAPPNESNFTSYLRQMPNDISFFVGTAHPAGVYNIYPNLYDLGFEPDVVSGGINPMASSYNLIGDSISRSFTPFSMVDVTTDRFQSTAQQFYDRTGNYFDTTTANGYDVVTIIAEAIKAGGSADPVDIAKNTREGTFETMNAAPLKFTDWGTPDEGVEIFYGFETGSGPEYYPDGNFQLVEKYRSEKLPGLTPEEMAAQ